MSGGNKLRAEAVRLPDQHRKFHAGIAEDAGIRRLAAEVAVRKRAADLFLQRFMHVQHRKLHAHALGGDDRLPPGLFACIVEVHPVYLKARLLQQHGGHGGVHPAGKAQYDLAHFLFSM